MTDPLTLPGARKLGTFLHESMRMRLKTFIVRSLVLRITMWPPMLAVCRPYVSVMTTSETVTELNLNNARIGVHLSGPVNSMKVGTGNRVMKVMLRMTD